MSHTFVVIKYNGGKWGNKMSPVPGTSDRYIAFDILSTNSS